MAEDDEDYLEVAKYSIFKCEVDGSLTFKKYCEGGPASSGPNIKCRLTPSTSLS